MTARDEDSLVHAPFSELPPEEITRRRLEESLQWYRAKSNSNKAWYQSLRFLTILSAALIPFLSTNSEIPLGHQLAGVLGVLIAVMEGLQQLKQFHVNWVNYRATEEALKHEQYLYIGKAGSYRGTDTPSQLLAERVEALVGSEETKWMDLQISSTPARRA
jgi:hypothetical protein